MQLDQHHYRSKQKSEISSERGDLEGEIMEGLPNKPDGVICTVFFLCLGKWVYKPSQAVSS